MGSKSRRIGEDGYRTANSEYYSRHTADKFYKGSGSSSSRIFASNKYSIRHHEPTLSSKVVYDRHGRSPAHYERSPIDKGRFYDPRDRSPFPLQRDGSPFGRERSPYGGERTPFARERSPYGGERNPYGRERSPYAAERTPFARERSPYGGERTPYGRERSPYLGRTPYGHERSPYGRDRSPYGGERTPHGHEKSQYGLEGSPFHRGKSPLPRDKSPRDRGRNYERRCRSPIYSERSPQDRGRHHSRRDQVPNVLERSPPGRSKSDDHREASRKGGAGEKRSSQKVSKRQEDKVVNKNLTAPDIQVHKKMTEDRPVALVPSGSEEKDAICEFHIDEQSQIPSMDESTHADGPPQEEFLSMEEDMDICDTPPHVPAVPHVPLMPDSSMGKWYYIDYFGVEHGPSRLFDLKALVDDGVLLSDHFVKHMDTDRWVTVEKAVSPVVAPNFPSIFPEAVTQLVTPPEAPGNVLTGNGDTGQVSMQNIEDASTTSLQAQGCACISTAASEPLEELKVDERVGALLEGFTMVPGRELDTIGEVLQMTLERMPSEVWRTSEGCTWRQTCSSPHDGDELSLCDMKGKEDLEEHQIALLDPDQRFACSFDVASWFSASWSSKGGDWKRRDDAVNDRILNKKLVLNDGFPLCQMPKAGYEDPRWDRKDDLYYPSQSKRLDLPLWGFSCLDEKSDVVGRVAPTKPPVARGVKGATLSVIRINACVVKDHGSFISESRSKVRGKDRHTPRSARMSVAASDGNRSAVEGEFLCKWGNEEEPNSSWKSIVSITVPKDRLCSVDDLQLHLGDWYYLDGAGHVQGPQLYSELQALVDQGVIQNHISVFRKSDSLWVPVTSAAERSETELKYHMDSATPLIDSSSFHSFHPQFVGFTRGKLHELVMKAYKSREFAAAINEVLDPWISSKLPKKDSVQGKRPWLQDDDNGGDCKLDENLLMAQKYETSFEELCGDSSFSRDETAYSGTENGNWGLLDGNMLARVFHFLRLDMKSLGFASLTCKHWRAAVAFYKDISQHVDLSSFGPVCNDSMIWNVLNGYNRQRIKSVVLVGCTSITSSMLEQIIRSSPHLASVDIRGCGQFGELVHQFPNVSWIEGRSSCGASILEDPHFSKKTLKRKTEDNSDKNDFNLTEYIESRNNRDSSNQLFCRSLYKRSKLFDARKSSSIVSRDARTSRWSLKKSEIWPKKMEEYKRMEEFLSLGLRDIMKLNTFDFFVSKVSEMEERMKTGYYLKHGFGSVKNDIMRMCKEARKARIRGSGDINHTIDLFFKLVSHLGKSSKLLYGKDQLVKAWNEDLTTGSTSMRSKKSTGRHMIRNNGSANGSFDHGEGLTDREARKGASKWNKKSMNSGSDSSDDFGSSFVRGDSECTASDTESDSDFRPESQIGESRGDGCSTTYESCVTYEREWGARMTKAGLVPPVTRKYEVIDRYVIVADEEDVQRKMSVSLPDDYAEKLDAQKNGAEEDMELPEVKDYKPRKQLGEEVIEQEVYGIDPYTHNLLLDSMPEELGWTLLEKHLFIEDVLLRTLNTQVRRYTGTGNTPMIFLLQPVIEEIEKTAARDSDTRTTKMCRCILRAIGSRRDDRYVAYRKGLGVVCNKDGGFGEEDFVVEFLGEVYPAWKWFEKQDGIRSLQKDSQDPAPEFYNIYLERPKGDADGYDLVVVDAMHKANYASRICHSCRPNCEAKVTAVGGQYQIGIYAVREIQCGEEITFDYNSVTESKEEYEASVCLCGSQVCRGSYLNLTGEGAFQKVLKKCHGVLDRHRLMIEACQLNSVSEEDYLELGRAGLGSCLLGGLPEWVVAYSARLVRFINRERTKLPKEILRHNLEEKRKYFSEIFMEVERSDAEVQAEGVYNQRLQNLAVTLDKVRYVMGCLFGDPKKAPPPLEKLSPEETVSFLWKGEGSLVEELLQCMAPLVEPNVLSNLKSKIQARDPSGTDDVHRALRKSLLWLRDELRSLPFTDQCQHDAAADLIHVYAHTKFFFRVRKYMTFTSPPVYISPLDLGPKLAEKLGPCNHEYRKTYGENYCMGQLIFWHVQTNVEPDCSLDTATKGCLSLPNVASFYTKSEKPPPDRSNGSRLLRIMLERMEKRPQKPWPKDQLWSFKNFPDVIGSPMLDAILNDSSSIDKEMISWLKQRPSVFQKT